MLRGNVLVRSISVVPRYLTERKNPVFQVSYVAIIVLSYFAFTVYAFPYLPNPFLSEYHKY
jgi:hypothetical protein